MHVRPVVLLAALGALALTGCGSTESSDAATSPSAPALTQPGTDPSVSAPPTSAASTTEVAVPELLQFTAPLVGGGTFDGTTVAGTPTVFWFWAPG